MDRPYRIMILEDLPSDAILVKRVLKKNFGACDFQVVDNKDEFLNILPVFDPDIILSDYCIPGFDWHTALKLTQERQMIIPFIIVTGTMNPKVKTECLETGATDYLSKDNIEAIIPVITDIFAQKGLK